MGETVPGYGREAPAREGPTAQAGVPAAFDATTELGQTPASLFGVALPQGTGAPGTAPAPPGGDTTNEPGQLNEGISGLGPDVTAETGAPGSGGATASLGGGPDAVKFTRPGSFLSGTYVQDQVQDSVSGVTDWTQANDSGYGSGGPQLPGIKGNEPGGTGAGAGRVLRGGRGAS